MTSTTLTPTPSTSTRDRGPVARALSFAKAETRLLLRNRTAVLNSLLLPIALVAFFRFLGNVEGVGRVGVGAQTITLIAVTSLSFATYYNLVTTYVARREDLVLKRMRTGQVGDVGILAAVALPSVLVALVQIVVVAVGLALLGEDVVPSNALPVVLGLLLGTLSFTALAAASAVFTRTAETAQISTLPVLMVTMGVSGLFFPLSVFPDWLERIAHALPGAAVVDLLNLGLAGVAPDGTSGGLGDAVTPALILTAWVVALGAVVGRSFRWEPRR